jgi:putative oxygen-independent coproporphyrinogen III oxidase
MDKIIKNRIMMVPWFNNDFEYMTAIPISLYVHIPWCIKKCPYCDFNSHVARQDIPEKAYLDALISDFNHQLSYLQGRKIQTVFIGGGTPSLLSPDFYQELLDNISPHLEPEAEITLEANPGTIDFQSSKFRDYRSIGINRLSLGIQSLDDQKLKYLGRMHSKENAIQAIEFAKASGFDNFNCDLMFGLTDQTIDGALDDLQQIIDLKPTHLSWYQLTIEPNTHFYRRPPTLPTDDYIFDMQIAGQQLLADHDFKQYEVSAYTRPDHNCKHNLNYWLFGDYIGIGAGAHGKITLPEQRIMRTEQHKNPKVYMDTVANLKIVPVLENQYLFEFMLNALRLQQEIPFETVYQRCFLTRGMVIEALAPAKENKLIDYNSHGFYVLEKGTRFVNDILVDILRAPQDKPH